jgi:hypothetical protein
MHRKTDLNKISVNAIYYGVPILVALSSAFFQVSAFIRQAMVCFVLIWCIGGLWILDIYDGKL